MSTTNPNHALLSIAQRVWKHGNPAANARHQNISISFEIQSTNNEGKQHYCSNNEIIRGIVIVPVLVMITMTINNNYNNSIH